MPSPAPPLARLGASVALVAAAAAWGRLATELLGSSPAVFALGAATVPLALALAPAHPLLDHRLALPLLPAAVVVLGLAPGPVPGGLAAAAGVVLAIGANLPLARAARRALGRTTPAAIPDATGAVLGGLVALTLPPPLAAAAAAAVASVVARPATAAARRPVPEPAPTRVVGVALGAAGVLLGATWLRGIADPSVAALLVSLVAAALAASVARGLGPLAGSIAPVLGAAALLGAWVLAWKAPGLARMAVLLGTADAGPLPAAALRLAPLGVLGLALGLPLGAAWGPRPAHPSAWLALPLGLGLALALPAEGTAPLWLAGGVGASALLWSLAPATWGSGLAVAALALAVGMRQGAPDPATLAAPAWTLTRTPQAAPLDAEVRAGTTRVAGATGPWAGAWELRAPVDTWDLSAGAFQPGARAELLLTAEGLVVDAVGRGADAERFAGLLAPLLAAESGRVLVLGDDLGHALEGLLLHPVASVEVATPAPELVRAVAAADPARRARWLDPRVRLLPVHPAQALRTSARPDLVVEVLRAPWGDAQHAAGDPGHLAAVRRALPAHGLYVVAVHLDWFDEGAPAALAAALVARFGHVQAWLPPRGADTLLLAASASAPSLARLEERLAARPEVLRGGSLGEALDLASLAVADGAALTAWAGAQGRAPRLRLPGPGPAATHRPVLHLASLADHVARAEALWVLDAPSEAEALDARIQARQSFLRLLREATTGDMEAVLAQARALRQQGGAVATAALEPLIDPHVRDARRAIALAQAEGITSRSWDEALRYATTARMLAPDSPRPLVLLGDIALGRGKLAAAEDSYTQALAADPAHVPALFGRARAAMARGDHVTAEEALRQATRLAPASWTTWHTLGVYLLGRGALPEAEEALREAARLAEPGEVQPHLAIAELRMVEGRPDAALLTAQEALDRRETGYGWYLRGRAHFELGQLTRAEQDFRRAVILEPELAEARGGIGLVRWQQGDLEQAAEAFRAMVRLRPDSAAARENLRRIEEDIAATTPPAR